MTFTYNYKNFSSVSPDIIKLAKTDHERLWAAFTWESTPQGTDHWYARATGTVPLSDDDQKYLDWLMTQSEERSE